GVVRDYHFRSLHDPIRPLVLRMIDDDASRVPEAQRPFVARTLMVRISGREFQKSLVATKDNIAENNPRKEFEYDLINESLRELYLMEQRVLSLVALFGSLCVFVACLGLYGLTSFTTERRGREIAIRKVIGATSMQIVALLAHRMVLLIGIGGLIATVAT